MKNCPLSSSLHSFLLLDFFIPYLSDGKKRMTSRWMEREFHPSFRSFRNRNLLSVSSLVHFIPVSFIPLSYPILLQQFSSLVIRISNSFPIPLYPCFLSHSFATLFLSFPFCFYLLLFASSFSFFSFLLFASSFFSSFPFCCVQFSGRRKDIFGIPYFRSFFLLSSTT